MPAVGWPLTSTNVGYAATGGSSSLGGTAANLRRSALGAVRDGCEACDVSQPTPAVTSPASLTSLVATAGTAGREFHSLEFVGHQHDYVVRRPINSSNVFGVVGSQCDILDSTTLATSSTVTMAWRIETPPRMPRPESISRYFPRESGGLSSDIVDIEGVPSGTDLCDGNVV